MHRNQEKLDVRWFKIERYDGLKNLDLQGWLDQLEKRQFLMNFPPYFENQEADEISLLKTNPLSTNEKILFEADYLTLIPKFPFNTHTVSCVTVKDIFWGSDYLSENHLELVNSVKSNNLENDVNEDFLKGAFMPYSPLIKKSFGDEWWHIDEAFVSIKLEASNEVIIEDFKQWLQEYRKAIGCDTHPKHFGTNKKFKIFGEKTFEEWIDYKVLPYIDLEIIGNFVGKKIPYRIMDRLIDPEGTELKEETLVKETIPRAKWLIARSTTRAMRAQIEHEKQAHLKVKNKV